MEKLQAVLLGRRERLELVFAVRREYESIVSEIEGGKEGTSSVRWPKQRTLCLPSFLDTTNQLHTESVREGQLAPESVREGQLAPESVRESQLAPEQPVNQTSISLSSSDTPQEESKSTPLLPLSTTEREREEKDSEEEEVVKEKGQEEDGNEKEKGKLEENNEGKITHRPRGSVLETEAANTMLEWLNAAPLLVGEALPQDRAELMKLRLQTQMELVWLQQAIASRIKYLQLKDQMKD